MLFEQDGGAAARHCLARAWGAWWSIRPLLVDRQVPFKDRVQALNACARGAFEHQASTAYWSKANLEKARTMSLTFWAWMVRFRRRAGRDLGEQIRQHRRTVRTLFTETLGQAPWSDRVAEQQLLLAGHMARADGHPVQAAVAWKDDTWWRERQRRITAFQLLDWRAPELRDLLHPGRFRRVDWEEPCVRAADWLLRSPDGPADLRRQLRARLGPGTPAPDHWRELAARHHGIWTALAKRWSRVSAGGGQP